MPPKLKQQVKTYDARNKAGLLPKPVRRWGICDFELYFQQTDNGLFWPFGGGTTVTMVTSMAATVSPTPRADLWILCGGMVPSFLLSFRSFPSSLCWNEYQGSPRSTCTLFQGGWCPRASGGSATTCAFCNPTLAFPGSSRAGHWFRGTDRKRIGIGGGDDRTVRICATKAIGDTLLPCFVWKVKQTFCGMKVFGR